jgi:hypothetical protein
MCGNKPHQYCSIDPAQSLSCWRPPQRYVQLMTEEQILGFKPAAGLEQVGEQRSEQMQNRKHRSQRCNDSAR